MFVRLSKRGQQNHKSKSDSIFVTHITSCLKSMTRIGEKIKIECTPKAKIFKAEFLASKQRKHAKSYSDILMLD